MTLLEVRNDLMSIALSKEYIEEEDFSNIHFVSNGGPELKLAVINKALEQLEETKILVKCEADNKRYWILERNSSQIVQNVEISAMTAQSIAKVLRIYSDEMEEELSVDPNNISERDIQMLSMATFSLLEIISSINEEENNNPLNQ